MIIEITIENKPIKGNVMVVKHDSEKPEQILKGAVFAVYQDTDSDKKYSGTDKFIGNLTEAAGVHEYKDLLYGDYLLKEIKAPEGYNADNSYYPFSIRNDGETVRISNNGDDKFYNNIVKGKIEGIKVGESDEPLSGALIGLFAGGESEFTENNAMKTDLTDENGKFTFEDVVYGKYTVAEIKAPTGYILTEKSFPVTVDEDGETISVEIGNEKIRGSVRIEKYDEHTNEKLSGAVFEVYRDKNGNKKYDSDEETVSTLEETEKGIYQLDGLEIGDYLL